MRPVPDSWLEVEDARKVLEERSGHEHRPGRHVFWHKEASLAR
jgi:hypothetical protein